MIAKLEFIPHTNQRAFLSSNAKFRGIFTGVGFGKTAVGVMDLLTHKLQYPQTTFLILAPTYPMLKNVLIPEFEKWCPKALIRIHLKHKREIWLKGHDAPIIYLSADNERNIDRLRGLTIGYFWLDEGSMLLEYVWKIILARLRDIRGPLKGIITTTPRGYGWPYYYFVRKQNPKDKSKLNNAREYEWFTGSSLDNPYTPESYKQTLLDTYSGRFAKQEIYGEFQNFDGLVYSNFSLTENVVETAPTMVEYIGGVDWGFTNPTAGVIIGFDYDGRAYVLEEYYRTKTPVDDAIDWGKKMEAKYGRFTRWYGDPAGPEHIQSFLRAGLNMTKSDNTVLAGVNAVSKRIDKAADGRPRFYVLKRCVHFLDEIQEYRYAEVKEGKIGREDRFEGRDHLQDATRYCLVTHRPGDKGWAVLTDKEGLIF